MSDISAPSGTVTFLFTDVEGSTRLWEEHRDEMAVALERHDELLRSAIEAHDGYVFSTSGDAFAASFARAGDAVAAATDAQGRLGGERWPEGALVRVRMGVHTGEAQERNGDYFGPAVNRAARIMSAGHGGQVLVSAATAELVDSVLFVDLGEHRLKDLGSPERLFQVEEPGAAYPPLRTLSVVRNNLPTQRTALVGREDEIGRVLELLDNARLVTLTGVGGVGKTRLALAAAAAASDEFADGVFLADLTSLSSGEQVPGVLAEAVGLQSGGQVKDRVLEFLDARHVLVVLDNCEHLIDDVADLVDRVLETDGHARLLATSREDLEVDGERTFRVPSLPVATGSQSGTALELLVDRASSAGVGLATAGEEGEVLGEICERLDGMPLAIELAAAQLAHMSPVDLLARLDRRFDLLSGGRRRRRQRQQTLQAVMDWSWELLDADEQALLAHLGVMVGTWGLDDVEGMCRPVSAVPVASTLGSLVSKSLVQRLDDTTSRYRLLETVRLYAQQKLIDRGEADELRDRHLRWYVDNIGKTGLGPAMLELPHLARYRQSYDNIRAAIDWAMTIGDHDAAATLLISGTVQNFLPAVPNLGELVDLADDLASVVTDPLTLARLRVAQAWYGWALSDPALVQRASRQALQPASEAGDALALVGALALATFYSDDQSGWQHNLAEARTIAAASGSTAAVELADALLDGAHYAWSDMERLATELPQRIERSTGIGVVDIANFNTLVGVALATGDTELAAWATSRSETIYREAFQTDNWNTLLERALVAALNGNADRARAEVEAARSIEEAGRIGPARGEFLLMPAVLAARSGRLHDCAVLLAAIRNNPVPFSGGPTWAVYRSLQDQVHANLTEQELTTARTEGQQLTVEAALADF